MKVENSRITVELTDEDIKELVKQKAGVDLSDYRIDDHEDTCDGFEFYFTK